MKTIKLIVILSLLAQAFIASAQDEGFYFLDWKSIETYYFPTPPLEGTRADRKDVEEVIKLQRFMTEAQCKRARSEIYSNVDNFYGGQYGTLKKDQIRIIRPLMDKVFVDTDMYTKKLKGRWARKRPYLKDERVKLCVNSHASTSYPSGHSAIAGSFAYVLTQLFPEQKSVLLDRAKEIAFDRVLGGVHHPKDVKAGLKLGKLVYKALMKNPEFKKELNEAKVALKALEESKLKPQAQEENEEEEETTK